MGHFSGLIRKSVTELIMALQIRSQCEVSECFLVR